MQPPAPAPFDPTVITNAISGLKDDIIKEMDTRFATYDDKLKKVDTVSDILTEAQKAQNEELERRRQAAAAQNQYAPKTYQEIRDDAVKIALNEMKRTQEEEQRKAERERQQLTNEERELDQQLDRDMDTLEKGGYLPPRGNPNDYNDAGVMARRELLSRAAFLETPALDKIADELTQMHRNDIVWNPERKSWDSAENTLHPLPGKFAPVGNSSVNSPGNNFSGPSARELRTLSMSQLAQLPQTRGYGPVPVTSNADTGY